MLSLLDEKIGAIRENNKKYQEFEHAQLNREARGRLINFTPPRILESTVRRNINDIIIGHARKPTICLAVHESRDSFIDLHSCSNSSHACLHGETTFIPWMLIGAFLIKELTGELPFEHPGVIFCEMISWDQRAQRLYGTSTEDDRLVLSWMRKEEYEAMCAKISPEIEAFQTRLYNEKIHGYVWSFIEHIRKLVSKN